MHTTLEGKKILITGSSRGIGAAIARIAKDRGATVVLHGRTLSEELQALSSELGAEYVVFDVSNTNEIEAALSEQKDIDILVNNAGVNPSKTFADLTPEDWKQIFDVNVFGLAHVCKLVIPHMVKRNSGAIVNISSLKGLHYVTAKPAYAASKAAVIRLTTSMAEEFSHSGIRVNAVAPGFTETEMTKASMSTSIQKQIDAIPLGRIASPEEIARAVLFLSSDEASYITGHTLVVDGGASITS